MLEPLLVVCSTVVLVDGVKLIGCTGRSKVDPPDPGAPVAVGGPTPSIPTAKVWSASTWNLANWAMSAGLFATWLTLIVPDPVGLMIHVTAGLSL